MTVADLLSASLDGVELIHTVRQAKPQAEFLMLSSGDLVNAVVAAVEAGATDLLARNAA